MARLINATQPVIITGSGKQVKAPPPEASGDASPTKAKRGGKKVSAKSLNNNNSESKENKPGKAKSKDKAKKGGEDGEKDGKKSSKDDDSKKRKKKHDKKDKEKKRKDKKEKSKKDGEGDDEDGEVELSKEVFNECKEKMRPMKKALKALGGVRDDKKLNKKEKKMFNEHIKVIGAHIDKCQRNHSHDSAKMKEWRNNLWTFVSQFTSQPAKKLYKIYRHLQKTEKGPSAGPPPVDQFSDHSNHSMSMTNHHSSGAYSNSSSSYRKGDRPSDSFGGGYKREYSNSSNNSSSGPPSKFSKHSHRDYPGSYSSSSSKYNSSSYHNSSYQDGPSGGGGGGRAVPWTTSNSSSSKHDNYRSSRDYHRDDYRMNDRSMNHHRSNDRYYDNRRPPPMDSRSSYSSRDGYNSRTSSMPSSATSPPIESSYNSQQLPLGGPPGMLPPPFGLPPNQSHLSHQSASLQQPNFASLPFSAAPSGPPVIPLHSSWNSPPMNGPAHLPPNNAAPGSQPQSHGNGQPPPDSFRRFNDDHSRPPMIR